MKNWKKYILLFFSFFLFSCGFKIRPVVPTTSSPVKVEQSTTTPVKYCSPYDPRCPLRYAGYVQGLNPKKSKDKKKIEKIEAVHRAAFTQEQRKKSESPGS